MVDIAPTTHDSPWVQTTPVQAAHRASFMPVFVRIAQLLQAVGLGDRSQSREPLQPARRVCKICGLATAGGSGRGGAHPCRPAGAPGVRRRQIAGQRHGARARAAAKGVVFATAAGTAERAGTAQLQEQIRIAAGGREEAVQIAAGPHWQETARMHHAEVRDESESCARLATEFLTAP